MLLNAWRALVVRWAAKVSGVLLRRRRNVKGESDARGSEACHCCKLDGVDWTDGLGVVNCGGRGGADEDADDEEDDDDVDVDVAARLGFSC